MGVLKSKPDFGDAARSETRLSEMKVAAALLRGEVHRHRVISIGDSTELTEVLEALSEIAYHLGNAPYLFRDDPIVAIANIISELAGLADLREDES